VDDAAAGGRDIDLRIAHHLERARSRGDVCR
jgi:hypothetical protein